MGCGATLGFPVLFTPFLISNAHFIEGTNGEIKEKIIFVTIQYVKPILQSHSRHIIKST